MNTGEKIKQLRISKGLTLEQVAQYVGVSKPTVLKWERGIIQNMRRDKILKLAQVLGTTPEFLMGWEDVENTLEQDIIQMVSHLSREEQEVVKALIETMISKGEKQ